MKKTTIIGTLSAAFLATVALASCTPTAKTYHVKFTDGNEVVSQKDYKENEIIVAPSDLKEKHAKEGEDYYHFAFDGWYDGTTKFVEGTKTTKDVTYTSKFNKGSEIEHLDGEVPTCIEPGFMEAYRCADCAQVEGEYVYYDAPDSIDQSHLIGSEEDYNAWIKEGGKGYLAPTGEHDYSPIFKGTYKTTYNALETFDSTGLEVYLHCSYEPDDTHDVKIEEFHVEYEAADDKLHVNDGGAYVSFTYEGEDYEKDLGLTVNPIKVDEPAEDTTSFTYDGSEQTYDVTETDDYSVSGNKQTDAGEYTVTISLKDDSGDHVWATSEDTDDLEYDFIIAKGTNAIEGFATSYTTTCHTAPTISGVTSTFGTVQYEYYKKVGEEKETKVTVDQLEAAENTTYRVRAFVPGTGNYDEVEQYATLTVNHDWGEEYAPTDVIGYKAHECKKCKKVENTTNVMANSDIKLIARTEEIGGKVHAYLNYGASEGLIQPVSASEPFLENDVTWQFDDTTVTTPREIKLPKINFEAYQNQDILLKFRTNNANWEEKFHVHLGTNAEGNNLFDGSKEAFWSGSGGPDTDGKMTGYFLLNYNSTNKELTIKNTIESDKVVTITDSDIIQGNKSISLYGYCGEGGWRTFALFEGCIELNHTHSWGEEYTPTDIIGLKAHQCTTCKEIEYTTNLMVDSDIKIEAINSYGADANHFYTNPDEGLLGMAWRYDDETVTVHEMKFPKVMFKEYSQVTFNYTTNEASWGGGQVGVGTSSEECDLISYVSHRQALSGKITATYNASTQELTLTAYDVTAQNGETQLGTKTISIGDGVASGNENLSLFSKTNFSRGFGITSVNVETE